MIVNKYIYILCPKGKSFSSDFKSIIKLCQLAINSATKADEAIECDWIWI